MRMLMIYPKILCDDHLIFEHDTCHLLAGAMITRTVLNTYAEMKIIEPGKLRSYHDELAREIDRRGHLHNTKLIEYEGMLEKYPDKIRNAKVDMIEATMYALNRCKECEKRYKNIYFGKGDTL